MSKNDEILFPGWSYGTDWSKFYIEFPQGGRNFIPSTLGQVGVIGKGRTYHQDPGTNWANSYLKPGDSHRWSWLFWGAIRNWDFSEDRWGIPANATTFIVHANIITSAADEIVDAKWEGSIPR